MGRTTTLLDDALTRAVGGLPMTPALMLAGLVYGGIGLALPLSLGLSTVALIAWNFIGVMFGWAISLAWLFPQLQATRRRLLLEWTTDLRRLSATEFEWLVGEVLRREGWGVEETGRADSPDGNIDLRIRRPGRELIVQCKRWESRVVGVDEVRKLAGTIARERLPLGAGILVTLSEFSEAAIAEAESLDIEMVDNHALLKRIERVRAPEPCPSCGTGMLLDRSQRGWWLRCPRYKDGCNGKRDLASDPWQAVDLLLAPG